MRRRTVHTGFTILTVCLSTLAALHWLEITESRSIAEAVAEIPASLAAAADSPRESKRYPESSLARANALSLGGSFNEAESAFNELINQNKLNAIGQAAQYNLANAYLRQGMRSDVPASRRGPMLELAKQRYRDLLRVMPNDWDARYNLELALRLAPENAEASTGEKIDPVKSVRVIVPDFQPKDLP